MFFCSFIAGATLCNRSYPGAHFDTPTLAWMVPIPMYKVCVEAVAVLSSLCLCLAVGSMATSLAWMVPIRMYMVCVEEAWVVAVLVLLHCCCCACLVVGG